MSTLKVNNLQNIGGTNLLAPIQSGSAKAWVNVNGGSGVPAGNNLSINDLN